MSTVYLNGAYLPADEARISPDDRGFLLADGVYEVTPAYRGRFFRLDRHVARLERGLDELRIDFPTDGVVGIHRRLLEENDLTSAELATVYLQVTRGTAPRRHAFPASGVEPTVYAFAGAHRRPPPERWEEGFRAVTLPDRRWARVDIKTIALLPNVLAQQAAVEAGADDAILVGDGVAREGSHANLFFVFDGVVTTHPATNEILPGVTREHVLELARELGHPVRERAVQVEEIENADEIFLTGTTTEVRPLVEVDGREVGGRGVGPVTRSLSEAFREAVERAGGSGGSGA